MDRRVEGVYPTVDEASEAINRLRKQGYSRDDITLVANAEVRDKFRRSGSSEVDTEEIGTNHSTDHAEDNDHSLWDSIKDFFTFDDSNDDPDYPTENDPVTQYSDVISQGQIAVLVNEQTDSTEKKSITNTQPNTIGPDGTRSYEDEQTLGSRDEYLKDQELSRDELDDYERRQ